MNKRGGIRKGAGRKALDGKRIKCSFELPEIYLNNLHVKGNKTRAIIEGLKLFIAQKESLKQTPERK